MYKVNEEITKQEIAALITSLNPVILDIGCYDGSDGAGISALIPKAEVHFFECDPRSINLLRSSLPFSINYRLYEIALANFDGSTMLYQSDSDTRRHFEGQESWSASSSIKSPAIHLNLFPDVSFLPETLQVKCERLDSWYSSHLKPRIIDFIWADVNGAEGDLIEGGLETLIYYTRYLYIEFSDKELYKGQINRESLEALLPSFEVVAVYNWQGNFGNLLLKNKNL